MKIVIISFIFLLSACSTSQVKKSFQFVSGMMGGNVPRNEFLDRTAKEELDRKMKICLNGEEYNLDKIRDCTNQVYQEVKEEKGLDGEPVDGTVIIREVGEDEVLNSDQ